MTNSTNAPQSSEISGPASLGIAASSAIGQLRSGTPPANTLPAAALAKLTPQETNGRMEACLERISGRRPVFGRKMMFPANGPAYSIAETASWKCATESQRNEALAAVEFALRPAAEDEIGAALYTLRIMTRGRGQVSDADREAEAMIWLAHLQRFPADIVLMTLKAWPMRPDGQWWPTWHDVQKDLDAQTSARRLLAEHIRSGACIAKPQQRDEPRDDSPEGIAHRKAVVERAMAKLTPRETEPVNHVEDFNAWEARTLSEIAKDNRAGKFRLSREAHRALRREMSNEEFDRWYRDFLAYREGEAA